MKDDLLLLTLFGRQPIKGTIAGSMALTLGSAALAFGEMSSNPAYTQIHWFHHPEHIESIQVSTSMAR